MIHIIAVCTGNICRSPLASLVLATKLADPRVTIRSSGVRARDGLPITAQAGALAARQGVSPSWIAAHRSRYLVESHLAGVDLVLAMSREHRRAVVEMDPSLTARTFTVREFARLSAPVSDERMLAAAPSGTVDVSRDQDRLSAFLGVVAAQRGTQQPSGTGKDDDVIDPFGRSEAVYLQSDAELQPSLEHVVRIVKLALA
ncbi:arsenate reductase/protein-tyrosine-phosphatase family protein [Microbacterium enclense]|uniref:arsenate reductase/protein-tyrosine-phosphatase family protein n=1 Tax=Microbacterium enclense TaxID=993073 RepID=UPI003F81ACDF